MKKTLFLIILILILLFSINIVVAAKSASMQIDLLVTNYRDVDTVIFTRVLSKGEQSVKEYTKDDIENARKSKVPNQRIITNYIELYNPTSDSGSEGSVFITVKMSDGIKIVSDDISVYSFLFNKDYVFNSDKMEFIDRDIWSRIPNNQIIIFFVAAMLSVYFAVQLVKLIIALILSIKPIKHIVLSFLYSAAILTTSAILGLRFIPMNIIMLMLFVVIVLLFFEYRYVNKKCDIQKQRKLFLYVIISKVIECTIVLNLIELGSILQ